MTQVAIPIGSLVHVGLIWTLADISITFMLIPNLIGVIQLYCSRPETWNLDRAKAPRIADHKSPYIVNILRLMIDDPRERSRRSKSKFMTELGITNMDTIRINNSRPFV